MKKITIISLLILAFNVSFAQERNWIKVDEQFNYVVLEENSKEKMLPNDMLIMELFKTKASDEDIDLSIQKPVDKKEMTFGSVSDRIGTNGMQYLKKNASYLIKYYMGFEGDAYRIELDNAKVTDEQISNLEQYLKKKLHKQEIIKGNLNRENKTENGIVKSMFTTFIIPIKSDIKDIQKKFDFFEYTETKSSKKTQFVKIITLM